MSVCHLHVDTSVLTLLVVLCAPAVKDTYWVVMEVLALVCDNLLNLYALNCNSPNLSHGYIYACLNSNNKMSC